MESYGSDSGDSPRVLSVVTVGDVSLSIEVDRVLSEDELAIVKDRSIKDASDYKSTSMDNEACAVAVLEEVVAMLGTLPDVDVGEIAVKVGDITVSKDLSSTE
jgi:hypothetical protein